VRLERLAPEEVDWQLLDRYEDRLVYQTRDWVEFIAETQNADPVIAAVNDGGSVVGYFTGLIVRRFGIRILGSPLPGWTTGFMGFNLEPGVSRVRAAQALAPFAFGDLGCAHLEFRDRRLVAGEVDELDYEQSPWRGLELDLRRPEDELWASFKGSVRTSIRKAEKLGVTIEEASDVGFADDFYPQMEDVFAKLELAPPWGVERVRELIRVVGPTGRLLLLRARSPEGKCIATGIFPAMNRTMHFLSSASWRRHQHLQPNEPLMWHALRYWRARGIEACDLGGYLEYKRKWRGEEVRVPFLRKSRFRALSAMRRAAAKAYETRQRLRGRRSGSSESERSD
jgi:Acetyltransferase (GNAT) domain